MREVGVEDAGGVTIGVDVGGTKIAAGVARDGFVENRMELRTGASDGATFVIGQLRAAILGAAGGEPIARVGIGVPGRYDGTRILHLPNIPALDGIDLAAVLRVVIGDAAVLLENDARCFTLAESAMGVAKGGRCAVGFVLGTGVGGGIIVGGRVYRGAHGGAGEIGHIIADARLASFSLGQSGDWEHLVCGPAIVARYRALGGGEQRASEIWTTDTIIARETLAEEARLLAIFTANIATVLDPEFVVVGGGVATRALVDAANALLPKYGTQPLLRLAKLGNEAGILGAALLFK
jgi:glucokinase